MGLLVSIVIPTFNAGSGFEALLDGLAAQRGDFETEVLVIDSGSTDGTVKLAKERGATVREIPNHEFSHGATRNLGVSLARGKYVALTVQDALPLDEAWLATMVENLERDSRVAGVYGRQIPHEGSSPLTRALTNSLQTASLEYREQYAGSPGDYRMLPAYRRHELAAFDNVSACLRRSVWEELPFEAADFGEDLRWGERAVGAGYKLIYEPRSAVFHSHERGALYNLRRYYVDQLLLLNLFGLPSSPSLSRLLLNVARDTLHLYRLLRRDGQKGTLRPISLAVRYAAPAQIGAYLGCKSSRIRCLSPTLHAKLDRLLGKGI